MRAKTHVITLKDLSKQDVMDIVDRGAAHADGGVELGHQLAGKVVGIYFSKTSTRTRTSFSAAALRLGASLISYGPNDLQLNTGESIEDTLQVSSSMLDGLVVRTAGDPAPLRAFARQPRMSIVNAMTADEHPTQALADLTTLKRHFGRVSDLNFVYMGEGNNSAVALALAFAKFPDVRLSFFTPAGYGLEPDVLAYAQKQAQGSNTVIQEFHDMAPLPGGADVVYTTRWQTTGTTKPDPKWRQAFEPFTVTMDVMRRCPNAIFMHDLPAHRGDEVTAEVIDGERSIVFEQAENKLHSAKAVLEWCMCGLN